MKIRFHASDVLPDDVAVAVIPGDAEMVVLLDAAATTEDVCDGLNDALADHLGDSWLYVGGVSQ